MRNSLREVWSSNRQRTSWRGRKEVKSIDLTKNSKNSKTDLDTLYKVLLNKKQIRISSVSKLFNIEKDIAMDWAKILESGDIAIIDYPLIGGPIIKLKNKRGLNEKEGKEEAKEKDKGKKKGKEEVKEKDKDKKKGKEEAKVKEVKGKEKVKEKDKKV